MTAWTGVTVYIRGICLIEVTSWTGVTVYIRGICIIEVTSWTGVTVYILEVSILPLFLQYSCYSLEWFSRSVFFSSFYWWLFTLFSGDKIVFTSTDFSWTQTEEAIVLDCPSCGSKQIRVDCKLCFISTVGWKQVCIKYNKYLAQKKLLTITLCQAIITR